MKLIINGIEIPSNQYTGDRNFSIDIKTSDENGDEERNTTNEFILSGAAYELVKQNFIDVNGTNTQLSVEIWDNACCEEPIRFFQGILESGGVSWCEEDCTVNVIFTEQTAQTKLMDCLKSTLIHDNRNGFKEQTHPRMVYCVEMRPDFLQWVILSLGVIVNIILFILTPVVGIIQGILSFIGFLVDAVNLIPGVNLTCDICSGLDNDPATSLLQEYQALRDRINERLIGCGRKHPSPLVRSYINNVCSICGATFQSSILNNPSSDYWNLVYFFAPIEKGVRDDNIKWIEANEPALTLDLLIEQLNLPFNAKMKLIGTTLYFERKDFFDSGQTWQSYQALLEASVVVDKLCFDYEQLERPAFAYFKYSPDAVDVVGNEAHQTYNDIVEWNQPYSSLQSGKKEVVLPFGTPRFRDDEIDEDIYGWFEGVNIGGLGSTIQQYRSVLIIEKHLAFNPKLLIWDGNLLFGRVRRFPVPGFGLQGDNVYNFPMMFNEHNSQPNTAYPVNHPLSGLYPRFYSIDNPKLTPTRGLSFAFTFRYNCEQVSTSFDAKHILLPQGIGKITNINVNLRETLITVSGTV